MNVTGMNETEQLPPLLQLNEDRPFQSLIAVCLNFFINFGGKFFAKLTGAFKYSSSEGTCALAEVEY